MIMAFVLALLMAQQSDARSVWIGNATSLNQTIRAHCYSGTGDFTAEGGTFAEINCPLDDLSWSQQLHTDIPTKPCTDEYALGPAKLIVPCDAGVMVHDIEVKQVDGHWLIGGQTCEPRSKPIDVPAVQVTDKFSYMHRCVDDSVNALEYCPVPYPTCTDKTRILMHDQNTPPKYWCHKPQP